MRFCVILAIKSVKSICDTSCRECENEKILSRRVVEWQNYAGDGVVESGQSIMTGNE